MKGINLSYCKIFIPLSLTLCFLSYRLSAQQAVDMPLFIQQRVQEVEQRPELVAAVKSELSIFLKEKQDFDLLRISVLKAIQKSPNNRGLPDLLAWQYIQRKDFPSAYIQYTALDRLEDGDGKRMMDFGAICLSNRVFDEAARAFSFVATKGRASKYYQEARMLLLITKTQKLENEANVTPLLPSLNKDFTSFLLDFGKNNSTAKAMYNYARFINSYLHKPAQAINLLNEVIQLQGINIFLQAECKLELGNISLEKGDVWDAALLYGQVDHSFKEDALGQEAKLRSAKIYYYTGNFALATSQLEALKTATSELVSNDALELSLLIQENTLGDSSAKALKMYARADLLIAQNKLDRAQKTLDSIPKFFPSHALNDDMLMAEYRISIRQHQYQRAAARLQSIIDHYPTDIWGDDAVYHLAELNELYLHNLNKAKDLYQQVILRYPASFYVTEARKHFRKLRGDTSSGNTN